VLFGCKVDALARSGPLRIAHRGVHRDRAENSIDSFAAAIDLGADAVEFDVVLVAGSLAVAHSARERRTDSPLLDDALRFFAEEGRGAGLHLDLKSVGSEARVVEALHAWCLVDRTLISTSHASSLRAVRHHGPDLQLALTYPRDRFGLNDRRPFAPVAKTTLAYLRATLPERIAGLLRRASADALALHHAVVSKSVVAAAHERGAAVVAWTVDDRTTLERVLDADVDAVVTNDLSIFGATLSP
jgi:glycerophosphoryl diester phosphodiesterase